MSFDPTNANRREILSHVRYEIEQCFVIPEHDEENCHIRESVFLAVLIHARILVGFFECKRRRNRPGKNIYSLIGLCNHSIHDISRTEVTDQPYRLPRFNMPLELGIFLGAKRFGSRSSHKRCLVMDRAPYRYKRFISDIGGQDIKAHTNSRPKAIRHVRDWLQSAPGKAAIPGGKRIWQKYLQFRRELPVIADKAELDSKQLTFIDYLQLVSTWLERNR